MKKHLFHTIAALGATLICSCSGDRNPVPGRGTPVDFDPTITRASGAAWDAGDKIGIFMVAGGTATVVENAANKPYTYASSAFSATGSDVIYFPLSGKVDFLAYYPYAASVTGFNYPTDVTNQTSFPAIDLLWSNKAKGKDNASGTVTLDFAHMLCKLVLATTPGDGYTAADLAAMTVKVQGMNTRAAFDLTTGTFGTSGTPADIALKTATAGRRYEALVLPATAVPDGFKLVFSLNNAAGDRFEWAIPAGTVLGGGNAITFNLAVARTPVLLSATILPWTQADPIDDEAEME